MKNKIIDQILKLRYQQTKISGALRFLSHMILQKVSG